MADTIERIKTLETDMIDAKQQIQDIGWRLENGVKSFGRLNDRVAVVEERTTPKPPAISKIVGITLSIVLAGAGTVWGLANHLRDRPTVQQMEKAIHRRDEAHNLAGHKDMRTTIDSIKQEQGVQRQLINSSVQQQGRDTKKLDQILLRMPARKNRRRR